MFESSGALLGRTPPELLAFLCCLIPPLALAALAPESFRGLIGAVRRASAGLARRRSAPLLLLFFGVLGVRLALLGRLPVPVPGIHDEFSYLLLGDTLAHGRLTNPSHPLWLSFETFHVNWLPTYASKYPPGQGAVLALGELAGHPWIGVLLVTAVMCSATLWMLRAWVPCGWALLGALLVAVKFGFASYWMNSYWGGALASIGGALVLGALPRLFHKGRVRDSLLLGLGMALLANTRPFEGSLLCLPVVFWLWWRLARKKKAGGPRPNRPGRLLWPLAAVLALTACFAGYYNWRLTGDPLLFPHLLNSRSYRSTGIFLWEKPGPPLHYHNQQFEDFYNGWEREEYDRSWKAAGCVTLEKLKRAGSTYFWWGALLLVPGLAGALRDRRMRLIVFLLGVGLAGWLSVIWSMPHYAAPFTPALYLILIQAARHLARFEPGRRPIGLALLAGSVLLLISDTTRAAAEGRCDRLGWTCQGDPSRAAIEKKLSQTPGKHLIVVRYGEDHNIHDEWVYNGAEIDSAKLVWARDLEEAENAKLFAYFKERRIWLVEPDRDNTELLPYPQPGTAP